jgi:hypothetical protein
MPEKQGDQYSDQEAQQRFEKLVHVALNTRPKPQKMMERKGVPAQSKKKRKRARKAA